MTGGQLAPTTLIGQRATTAVEGRTKEQFGMPVRMCELIAQLDGAVFVERVALDSPAHIRAAKRAVKRAVAIQQQRLGFGFVEFLSSCPTNWGLTPLEALDWMKEKVIPYYPVKNFRDAEEAK